MPTNSLMLFPEKVKGKGAESFISILMRSQSYRDVQYMSLLMEITMLNGSASLTMFIEDLDDLESLFKMNSDIVTKFFMTHWYT